MPTVTHSGDAGDVIAGMLIARQLGGANMILTQGPHPQRPFKGIANMLLPLMRTQPYIHSAEWMDHPVGTTHEIIHWRTKFYRPTRTLAESQADSLGMVINDFSPWLSVPPSLKSSGRIVMARTRRYNNPKFPWRMIMSKFRNRLLFVGLEDERQALERISGFRLDHHKIRDFLDMASIIAGSDCLISNQTCAYWIAAAMGHPLIQETENTRRIHDSQVPRPNAIYSDAGQFPAVLPIKMKFEYVPNYEI